MLLFCWSANREQCSNVIRIPFTVQLASVYSIRAFCEGTQTPRSSAWKQVLAAATILNNSYSYANDKSIRFATVFFFVHSSSSCLLILFSRKLPSRLTWHWRNRPKKGNPFCRSSRTPQIKMSIIDIFMASVFFECSHLEDAQCKIIRHSIAIRCQLDWLMSCEF